MARNLESEARIVDAFYRGISDESELHRAINLVALHFDSPSACLGEADMAKGRWMIGSGPVDTARLAHYAAVSAYDPAPRAFSSIRVCSASTSDRLFSDQDRRRSAFLNEYLRPAGLDHSMGSPLIISSRRFALIGVHQALNRPRFDDDDIACLERLTPHAARALDLRHTFQDLRRKEATFEALVDRHETGMIGICRGRALFVNRAAQAIAAGLDGLALDRTGLPLVAERASAAKLARLQDDVLRGGCGGIVRVDRPSGRRPYILMVSRLPSTENLFADHDVGVLLSIHDPCTRKLPTEKALVELLNIPLGPARVVRALLEGYDLKIYAEQAKLTINTVRCQLKAAFSHTETHSQAELMRLALSALTAFDPARAHI